MNLLTKTTAGILGLAVTVEAAMLGYTWAVPDAYTDFTTASCTVSPNGSAKITALGKDGDTYRQRTFVGARSSAGRNHIFCSSQQNSQPELTDKSVTCTFRTRGQYIPQLGISPRIDWAGTTCTPVTAETLADIKTAQEQNKVSNGFVVRMMK